jgi:hypothetical protein
MTCAASALDEPTDRTGRADLDDAFDSLEVDTKIQRTGGDYTINFAGFELCFDQLSGL